MIEGACGGSAQIAEAAMHVLCSAAARAPAARPELVEQGALRAAVALLPSTEPDIQVIPPPPRDVVCPGPLKIHALALPVRCPASTWDRSPYGLSQGCPPIACDAPWSRARVITSRPAVNM